jgi:anti-sigma regulatory factor (Ser/Thr protein kinase)
MSGAIGPGELNRLVLELSRLHRLEGPTAVAIDLTELTDLSPSALALIVASLRRLSFDRTCDPIADYRPPSSGELDHWLGREALAELLTPEAGLGPPQGGGRPRVRGCEPFSDIGGVFRASAALHLTLAEITPWSEDDIVSVCAHVSDLAKNVLVHSGAHGGGVAAVEQVSGEVEIAIADRGTGVRESITKNPRFSSIGDDLSAIEVAVLPGRTSRPGIRGGMGLFLARVATRANGGRFTLRSGTASLEQSDRDARVTHLPPTHGTLVTMRLRTDSAVEYEESLERPAGAPG